MALQGTYPAYGAKHIASATETNQHEIASRSEHASDQLHTHTHMDGQNENILPPAPAIHSVTATQWRSHTSGIRGVRTPGQKNT